MSQDDIISKLMDETFEIKESSSRIVTNPDFDFHVMTQISRLPLLSLRGYLKDGIAEFGFGGQTIHFPLDHLHSAHPSHLARVLGSLMGQSLDSMTIVSSHTCIWLFVWDSSESIQESDIQKIFIDVQLKKAA